MFVEHDEKTDCVRYLANCVSEDQLQHFKNALRPMNLTGSRGIRLAPVFKENEETTEVEKLIASEAIKEHKKIFSEPGLTLLAAPLQFLIPWRMTKSKESHATNAAKYIHMYLQEKSERTMVPKEEVMDWAQTYHLKLIFEILVEVYNKYYGMYRRNESRWPKTNCSCHPRGLSKGKCDICKKPTIILFLKSENEEMALSKR